MLSAPHSKNAWIYNAVASLFKRVQVIEQAQGISDPTQPSAAYGRSSVYGQSSTYGR